MKLSATDAELHALAKQYVTLPGGVTLDAIKVTGSVDIALTVPKVGAIVLNVSVTETEAG